MLPQACVDAWLQLGEYDKALEDYSAAITADPGSSFALYNRGITADRVGDYAAAVRDFSAALKLTPGNADFHHNRGFSLRKLVRATRLPQHTLCLVSRSLLVTAVPVMASVPGHFHLMASCCMLALCMTDAHF